MFHLLSLGRSEYCFVCFTYCQKICFLNSYLQGFDHLHFFSDPNIKCAINGESAFCFLLINFVLPWCDFHGWLALTITPLPALKTPCDVQGKSLPLCLKDVIWCMKSNTLCILRSIEKHPKWTFLVCSTSFEDLLEERSCSNIRNELAEEGLNA